MDLVVLPLADPAAAVSGVLDPATLAFSNDPVDGSTSDIYPSERPWRIPLHAQEETTVRVAIEKSRSYAFFTQHGGLEYDVRLLDGSGESITPAQTIAYKPTHAHDATVTSVGIEMDGDCVEERLDVFFRNVLQKLGPDIFRMKGVLSIEQSPRRFVFQGVHMLFDGRPDREWGSERRHNMLVFIGRNLDREQLTADFRACLA